MSGLLFKRITTVVVVLASCLPVTLAFAAAPAAPATDSGSEGSAQLGPGNSRKNSAVIEAKNIAPGGSSSATVTITNRDRVPASFTLSKHGLREEPGRGGGKLSARLELRVEEVTVGRPRAMVYRGALGSMPRRTLGKFVPGESRTYRFTVTFPNSRAPSTPASADNAYMGGSLSIDFHWRSSR